MSPLVPPYIDRLVPYVPGKPVAELERELGIRNAIKLASNESPLGPSPRAMEAIARATAEVHRYPDGAGYALRTALAAFHGISTAEVVLGNGSNELIDLACRTFASPTDHAVFGDPSFICYRLGCTAANVPYTEVALDDHLFWNVDRLFDAVTPKTRLLFLTNPNNPTGTYLRGDELERLIRGTPASVVIVVDEAYIDFADADDFRSAATMFDLRERLVVLRTFSKAYGLAGLRVGYGIGPRRIIDYLNRVRAPFNANSIGQAAAQAALADAEYVAAYRTLNRQERARLTRDLTALGRRVAPSQANFVLVDFERPGRAVYEELLQQGVIVRPMPPPIENWLRITVGRPEENTRLLSCVEHLK